MSHAVSFSRFGEPEVLEWIEVAAPEAGPGQVLIEVRAASVNPIDAKIRRGEMEAQFTTRLPSVPGQDVAGVITAIGEGVNGVEVGDEILGSAASGAYAEIAAVKKFAPKPEAIDWRQAAALPMIGETAVRALGHLDLDRGQTLLILGAAGNVGGLATQMAVARGIEVIGAVGEVDEAKLSELGGTPVRYGPGLAERVESLGVTVDSVLDTAGHGPIEEVLGLVDAPTNILTLVDFAAAERFGIRATGGDPSDRAEGAVEEIAVAVAAGDFDVPIWATYPMPDAAGAHRDLEAGKARGKLVLVN